MKPPNYYTTEPDPEHDPDDNVEPVKSGCGCSFTGCFSLVLLLLLVGAIFWGLRLPGGTLNIDIVPPGVYWYPTH